MPEQHEDDVTDPAELLAVAGNRQRLLLDLGVGRLPKIDREVVRPWECLGNSTRERQIEIRHGSLLDMIRWDHMHGACLTTSSPRRRGPIATNIRGEKVTIAVPFS